MKIGETQSLRKHSEIDRRPSRKRDGDGDDREVG
jgi:hypothetical protein